MLIDKPSAFEMTTPRSLLMYISLIIIGFGASIEAFLNRCEKGWVPFGRNCYKFSSSTATFKDAMIICNAYGGRLLELKSKWEESWLDLQCHVRGYKPGVWLGVSYSKEEGQFLSLSDARKPRYSNWIRGQPDNAGKENCVSYWTSLGGWNDWSCTQKAYYVCEN
uniref:C-type lectin domain-containing protein n=1 Tax=Magallana gigas TaxID=29159 RepID=A0A8W8P0N4_MAGGI|nr:perlucin-like protein [Crassostrea gigas]